MDESLDEWFEEYRRLSQALDPYQRRIVPKVYGPGASQPLTEPERVFFDLWYYWSAAIVNNGDVFGYLPFIIEHEVDFVAIGAKGTLNALANLMPYYREQKKLNDESEEREYWRRTKDDRARVEGLADGVHEFARLLLEYAEKNLKISPTASGPA